ncbi:MAG: hypothetical protein QOI01_6943 [Mycobacterium sp.]|jgi:hypothetical protein|nr:hypothetical protein [Mycobacterium sp.]
MSLLRNTFAWHRCAIGPVTGRLVISGTVLNQTPDVAKVNWQNNSHMIFYKIGDPQFLKIQQEIVDAAYKVGGLKTDADASIGYTTILDPTTTG